MGQIAVSSSNGQVTNTVSYRWGSGRMYTSLDGFSFVGNGIPLNNPVRIIKPDMVATNGVIQKINQVFILHY